MNYLDRFQTALETAVPDQPPVGANLLWPSPEFSRILVVSVAFTLTTDATVASRRVTIQCNDGTIDFAQAPAAGDQVASEAINYYFAPCILGIDGSDDHSRIWSPISQNFFLDWQDSLRTAISNIQSGDQISDPRIRYYQSLPR